MYRDFKVEGFRGLHSVSLSDMARINVVSGRNDVGKSALLEALFLHACGPFAANNALQMLRPLRGQPPVELAGGLPDNPWLTFFENFDLSRPIRLEARDEQGVYTIELRENSDSSSLVASQPAAVGSARLSSASILLNESRNGGDFTSRRVLVSVQSEASAAGNGMLQSVAVRFQVEPPPHESELRFAFIANNKGAPQELAEKYSRLRQRKTKLDLVEALRGIDPRIRNLEVLVTGGQSALHVEMDDGLVLPINLLGDGPVLLATALLGMVDSKPGGLVLLDEIENGLHWSALPHMWKTLHRAAERFDVQVVASTHSRECLAAAVAALEGRPNELRLYRLGPRDEAGSVTVAGYGYDQLKAGIEMDLDLKMIHRARKTPFPDEAPLNPAVPHLFLVEGGDDQAFLEHMLTGLVPDDCLLVDMGGVTTNWSASLQVLTLDPGFAAVNRSVGLVQDADTDPKSTLDRCAAILESVGFPRPTAIGHVVEAGGRRAGVLVLPPDAPGALEHVVLDGGDPIRVTRAREYVAAVSAEMGEATRNEGKAAMQAYLAALPMSPRNVAMGLAKGGFDLSGPDFEFVREFLRSLTAP